MIPIIGVFRGGGGGLTIGGIAPPPPLRTPNPPPKNLKKRRGKRGKKLSKRKKEWEWVGLRPWILIIGVFRGFRGGGRVGGLSKGGIAPSARSFRPNSPHH